MIENSMTNGELYIGSWRTVRRLAPEQLADKIGFSVARLEEIEAKTGEVTVSQLEAVARALELPVSWLFLDPAEFQVLFSDMDEGGETVRFSQLSHPDPVLERIAAGSRQDRTLYTLLTALLESDDAKLLRAAEMSLRSLLKQSRHTALPWQSRVPGNFEPPSD